LDPTRRFSDRVANYTRYRPGYPEALVRELQGSAGVTAASVVADVGSGTGISTELFLRFGCEVFAVEPNAEMRHAAEEQLAGYPGFHSVAAPAERTTLPDASVDLVAAGQAFHWFDVERTRDEFARILRRGGPVCLFWNTRRTDDTPFASAYERLLLRFGTDYREVDHRNVDATVLGRFFAGPYRRNVFANSQTFDLDGLTGRLLSSSYVPPPGHPDHAPMLEALAAIFAKHAEGGRVRFSYDTELYVGGVGGARVSPPDGDDGSCPGS
jgi:SAM-dependent methyltransferase